MVVQIACLDAKHCAVATGRAGRQTQARHASRRERRLAVSLYPSPGPHNSMPAHFSGPWGVGFGGMSQGSVVGQAQRVWGGEGVVIEGAAWSLGIVGCVHQECEC